MRTRDLITTPLVAALLAACGDTSAPSDTSASSTASPCHLLDGDTHTPVTIACGIERAVIQTCVFEDRALSCANGTHTLTPMADDASQEPNTLAGREVHVSTHRIDAYDPDCPIGGWETVFTFPGEDTAATRWTECFEEPEPCDPGSRIVTGSCQPVVELRYTGELTVLENAHAFHPTQQPSAQARTREFARELGEHATPCSGTLHLPRYWPESTSETGLYEIGALPVYRFTLEVDRARFQRSSSNLTPEGLSYTLALARHGHERALELDLYAPTLETPDRRPGHMSLSASTWLNVPGGPTGTNQLADLGTWRSSLSSDPPPRVRVSSGPADTTSPGVIVCELQHIFSL